MVRDRVMPASEPWFVLCAPLLPLDGVRDLRRAVEDVVVRMALADRAPQLDDAIAALRRGETLATPIALGLTRHLARMASRAAPLQLFSGAAAGAFGERTELALDPAAHRRRTQLPRAYLAALCERTGRLAPTPTLVRRGDRRIYLEPPWLEPIAMDATLHLDAAVARAGDGASVDDLASAVAAVDDDVDLVEARAYIHALAAAHVLVPDPPVPLSGAEELAEVLGGALRGHLADLRRGDRLPLADIAAQRYAAPVDEPPPIDLESARAAAVPPAWLVAEHLAAEVGARPEHDLHLAARSTLGPRVRAELLRGAELLAALAPSADPWAAFAAAFTARHGDARVPLVDALDERDGLPFAGAPPRHDGGAAAYLTELHARSRGSHELVLTDADLVALRRPVRLAGPAWLRCALVARPAGAADAGDFRLRLDAVVPGSPAAAIGRHAGEPELLERIRAHAARHVGDALHAELADAPEALRPRLYPHELSLFGRDPTSIPLADLDVTVLDGRPTLWSRSRDREVRLHRTFRLRPSPRAPAILRFLHALAGDDAAAWSWGPCDTAPFSPRVTYGPFVLARARWVLARADLDALPSRRASRGLPSRVVVADGDGEHTVDLDDPLALASLLALLAPLGGGVLLEELPSADELCLRSPAGGHVHELLVPLVF